MENVAASHDLPTSDGDHADAMAAAERPALRSDAGLQHRAAGTASDQYEPVTASLFAGPFGPDGRRALYFRNERPVNRKDGTVRHSYTLWAPWTVGKITRRWFWDSGILAGTLEAIYEITLHGDQPYTIELGPDDLAEMGRLNRSTQPAGGMAGGDIADPRHGTGLMQLRLYVQGQAKNAGQRYTTTRIGHVDNAMISEKPVYVFPDVTIDADGARDDIRSERVTHNRAAGHLDVRWDPDAPIEKRLSEWLIAAFDADTSEHGLAQTATAVGWAAAACVATRIVRSGLAGGFPLLWARGIPESGKTSRTPRLLAPFGHAVNSLESGLMTTAQQRDTFTAACDVPWIVDEVKLSYLGRQQSKLLELVKDAYNIGTCQTGGQFGEGNYRMRQHLLFPSVAFLSEDLPHADTAVADRVILLQFRRVPTLDDATRARAAAGQSRLESATAAGKMAPVAGAWYSWLAGQDLGTLWNEAPKQVPGAGLGERKASNFRCLLFGIHVFHQFLLDRAPSAALVWADVAEEFGREGLPGLLADVASLATSGGALGCLHDLATLSMAHSSDSKAPKQGTHYRFDEDGLWVQPNRCIAALKSLPGRTVTHLPTPSALGDELRQWSGVERKRKRPTDGPNAHFWYVVPWSTLEALGGPSKGDFHG